MKRRVDQEASMPRNSLRPIALLFVAVSLIQLACSLSQCQPVEFDPPAAGQEMKWTDGSGLDYVPGGSFVMGQDEVGPSDHSPAHTVTVDSFWIFQVEVTNRMYRACVELGVCTEPVQSPWYTDAGHENAPVSGVTWNQAKGYCEWIGGRLPTEAEWELAGRGTDARHYPWGEDEPTCDLLNFKDCLDPSEPNAVGSYPLGVSPFKVADMAGNVREWVRDWYANDYYASSSASNPTGPETGEDRVVRGSSYLSPEEETAIILRASQDPLQGEPTVGFRCVVGPDALRNAPMCNVVGYQPIWDPTFTARPSPAGNATNLGFYCAEGNYPVRAIVKFDFNIYNQPPSSVSPAEPDVYVTLLEQQPDRVECYGNAIQLGQPVTITFCFPAELPEPVPIICPHFYQYDPATGMCKYDLGYGGEQCQGGIVVEGYGCLPSPVDGQCPAGFYDADYNGQPVCVPTGGPLCLNPDRPPAVCPEGLTFNEGNICCESPQPVSPTCPSGFTLDAENAQCVPEPREWCTTISDVAPLCEPTPKPQAKPSCTSFTNQTDCANAGCSWQFTSAGVGFCK
jgi:sulfatase modifying factor 1